MFSRNSRSSRNVPSAIICRRSRLVAQITRTSAITGSFAPTGRISPDSRNRSSFTWMFLSSSPSSSRNRVPPLATSNSPLRSRSAPVNDPFLWPNSSLSTSVWRQRPAVDRDERHVRPLRSSGTASGRRPPCRSRLAGDEHPGVGRGDLVDEPLHRDHRRAVADQPARPLGRLHPRLQGRGLVLELASSRGCAAGPPRSRPACTACVR